MPNVTISVSDELKAEMDTISEVRWSEICRKAISLYILQRKNPNPLIELDLRSSDLIHRSYETGYPTLRLNLKVNNRMNTNIMIDRILSTARFFSSDNIGHWIGSANDLNKRFIAANSSGAASLNFPISKEKLYEFKDLFDSTFSCDATCMVYVESFKNEYRQDIKATIPIDIWKNVLKNALKEYPASQAKIGKSGAK